MPSVTTIPLQKLRGNVAVVIVAQSATITQLNTAPRHAWFMRRFGRWACVIFKEPFALDDTAKILVATETATEVLHSVLAFPVMPAPAKWPPWELLQMLEEWSILTHESPEVRRNAFYFHHLDRVTNDALIRQRRSIPAADADRRREIIDRVSKALYRRIAGRIGQGRGDDVDPDDIAYLSNLQVNDVLHSHFPDVVSEAGASAIALAYVQFASGHLTLRIKEGTLFLTTRVSNGSPNGLFMFAFAEFALAASHALCGLGRASERKTWQRLLPGMVAACEAYLFCYGELSNTGIAIPSPDSRHGGIGKHCMDDPWRESLLKEYLDKSPEWLDRRFSEIVACGVSSFTLGIDEPRPLLHTAAAGDDTNALFEPWPPVPDIRRGKRPCDG